MSDKWYTPPHLSIFIERDERGGANPASLGWTKVIEMDTPLCPLNVCDSTPLAMSNTERYTTLAELEPVCRSVYVDSVEVGRDTLPVVANGVARYG